LVLKRLAISVFLLCAGRLPAQQLNLPLNHTMNLGFLKWQAEKDSIPFHTGMKPIAESKNMRLHDFVQLNSTWGQKQFAYLFADWTWVKRKLKYESFFAARDKQVNLEINPLINFELGRDVGRNDAVAMYKNTRGFMANVHITPKLSFSTSFYENQMRVQTYLMTKANQLGPTHPNAAGNYVVDNGYANFFGQGRTKPFHSGGYDFSMATGYVSFKPINNVRVQFGTDKLFIGYGYRSLLLSDNSFSYPFLKTSVDFFKGRLNYTMVYASLMSLRRLPVYTTPEATFERKALTVNYWSYIVNKKLEIGFMEATVWQRMANFAQKSFDYSLLNPVPLVNTARFGLDSTNNVLLGFQGRYRVNKKIMTYGQYMLDGFDKHFKTGLQLGAIWFEPLGFKNWSTRFEYNMVTRYAYTQRVTLQNYGHYNLPLAHPWGAGFNEFIWFLNWRRSDFFAEMKWIYGFFRMQNGREYGKDIFLSDSAPEVVTTAVTSQIVYADFRLGYVINPITNLRVQVGFTNYYRFDGKARNNSNYLYVGVSTSLTNLYLDI
jgi:hypothetical protein